MLCHAIWRLWEHRPVSCGLKWLVLCFVGWGFLVNQWCFSELFIFLSAICPTLRQLIPCTMLLVFVTVPSPFIASAHAWLRLGYLNCSNLLWFSFLFTNIFLTVTESCQCHAHVKCVFPHFSSVLAWSLFSTEFSKRVISYTAPKGQTMVNGILCTAITTCFKNVSTPAAHSRNLAHSHGALYNQNPPHC